MTWNYVRITHFGPNHNIIDETIDMIMMSAQVLHSTPELLLNASNYLDVAQCFPRYILLLW